MKSKKKNINKKKSIILILIVVLIIIFSIVIGILEENEQKLNNNGLISEYESIEQILNKFGCKFIKEKKSSESHYSKDIYLEFKYNTVEGNESKKRYYESLILALSGFIKENYRLIDEQKDLVIEVQKNITEQGIVTYVYAINGITDYFVKQESILSLKNYKEDSLKNLQINSNIINGLIQNDWKPNMNFGTKDSSFDKYDIYFDEGIEVRKISGKVYNVVFTNKNQEEIVNGIKAGTSLEEVIRKLGEPIFGNKDTGCIGYKSNDIYVFFTKDEISIYRNEKYDTEKFEELLGKYIEKQIDIKEFMNELTYLWPDYEEYTYDSRYIHINYPTKGIEIQMNSDNPIGIRIYKNYSNLKNVNKYIEDGIIDSDLETDLLYEKEYNKKIEKEQQEYEYSTSEEYSMFNTSSNLYYCCVKNNAINLLSKDGNNPNRTININPKSIFWYSDTILVYSINNKGIYFYDLNTEENKSILEGKENFEIENYENKKIIYDNGKEINI